MEGRFGMSKLWLIVGGAVVVVLVAVGLYLNLTGEETDLQQAYATDSGSELEVAVADDEHIIGNIDAPVTIVEYASLTCSHCASFHADTLPEVKEQVIDTGKARLVFRDFPLDRHAPAAHMLVRCVAPAKRSAMLDLLFATQDTWARSQDPQSELDRIGRSAGMTSEAVKSCLNDQSVFDAVIAQRLEGEQKYQIQSTPSFIIGGKLYRGGISAEQMVEIVNQLAE